MAMMLVKVMVPVLTLGVNVGEVILVMVLTVMAFLCYVAPSGYVPNGMNGSKTSMKDESFSRLQRRIVLLLGRLSFEYLEVLQRHFKDSKIELAWSLQPCVFMKLPYEQYTFNACIDSLLPRLTELALSSSQRHLKVAACGIAVMVTMGMGMVKWQCI